MDKTLAILQPVVYWIANTSELYYYIRRLSIQLGREYMLWSVAYINNVVVLDLQDQVVQEALVVLSNAVTYAFQQTFYPVGKVCMW